MARHLHLRQIEAFKAVIENGTVSRGADMLNISQPSMSKLITHLEADTGLKLFDRLKGRLAPTEQAMLLYEEIERIFAGVRQVENAVDAIRRREQGRISIGVLPALSGSFIQQTTSSFLKKRGNVFCSVQSMSSQRAVEWVIARKLDVGIVSQLIDNPYVTLEPLMEEPLVCIMPLDHELARKSLIEPADLDQTPFVAFNPDTYIGRRVDEMFEAYKIRAQVVLVANVAPTLCEFVAAGLGVALVHPLHPLTVNGLQDRLVVRRFEPRISFGFQLCRSADSRNVQLVDGFAEELRRSADEASRAIMAAL